jgi:NAD(P)-dependent dehydrogenase (short-subunit alcohol dehydrogenase family)
MTAYQSAKWAVGGFSEALAAEVAGASMTTPLYQDAVH